MCVRAHTLLCQLKHNRSIFKEGGECWCGSSSFGLPFARSKRESRFGWVDCQQASTPPKLCFITRHGSSSFARCQSPQTAAPMRDNLKGHPYLRAPSYQYVHRSQRIVCQPPGQRPLGRGGLRDAINQSILSRSHDLPMRALG